MLKIEFLQIPSFSYFQIEVLKLQAILFDKRKAILKEK